jgi:hypothetical protein
MSLIAAVDGLLRAGLPGLFGGNPPAVTLAVELADMSVDALPRTAADTEPRLVERTVDLGDRDPAGVTGVGVRYSVVVVEVAVRVAQVVRVGLGGAEPVALERAEALVIALLTLERRRIAGAVGAEYTDGDYGAAVTAESVDVLGGAAADGGGRWLEIRARLDIAASRSPREDEGAPIARIATPGRPPRPDRPVDVAIDVS